MAIKFSYKDLKEYLTTSTSRDSIKVRVERDKNGKITIISEDDGIVKRRNAIVFNREAVDRINETKDDMEVSDTDHKGLQPA